MSTEAPLGTPEPPKHATNTEKKHRDWHDVSSLIVLGATLLAAVAAACFTGRQAYLSNKQINIARATLAVAQDTEQKQLRAYIIGDLEEIRDSHFYTDRDGHEFLMLHARWENKGATPAIMVRIKGFCSGLPEKKFTYDPQIPPQNLTLGKSFVYYTCLFRKEDVKGWIGTDNLDVKGSIWGVAEYYDIFGAKWETRYCVDLIRFMGEWGKQLRAETRFCEGQKNNCTDNKCQTG